VLLAAVIMHAQEGAFRNVSFPAAYLGFFAGVFRARDSPRHSPSCRLTTLIAEIESMGVQATSAEGHRVPDWYRLSPDTRITGIADTPSRRSS
jgi:hypothetical protein